MTYQGQISIDQFKSVLSRLGCTSEIDPEDEDMVWITSPHNNEFIVYPRHKFIRREHAIEIMKRFDVFDRFLSSVGVKINRV